MFSLLIQLYENNNNQSLPYYKLVVDPTNFMRTIQNAFKVSFLFRDGAIAITGLDKFGYPCIRPTQPSDKEANPDENTHQLVSSLTTKLCDVIVFNLAICIGL